MTRQHGRRPGPGGLWLLIALAVLTAGATLVITLRRSARPHRRSTRSSTCAAVHLGGVDGKR
jgi:hypothetical protein